DLERTAKAMLSSVSGPQKQDFIHNVMAETAFRVMRNEVVRNTPDASKVASASQLFSAARDSALVQLAPGRGPYRDLRAACNLLSEQLAGAIGEGFNADGATTALAYVPVNSDPLNVVDIDRWTPEYNKGYLDPAAGAASGLQSFLTPQWGQVKTILGAEAIRQLVEDSPGPARFLLNPADTYSLRDRTITSNGVTQAISKELIGTLINPAFISQAEKVVQTSASLTPTEKLIAEFWEDGGGTPFPPGSMMELGKFASEKYNLNTEMDTKLFFGLGKALMTSSVACWATKLAYDSTRPLIAIRELGKLGLIGEIDPVTGRSQVQAYDRATQTTGMIFADEWQTYQTTGAGYTPPFPEYTSGHSTFSASAARMIELVTGRSDFGGSISARSLIEKNRPETPTLNLSWATWDDAALQAANSRLYGGIHFESGNLDGRAMGQVIGNDVFARLQHFWG
ncbi:MAG: vanadium-dependent haloperoxidase, partial [Synechococcaceae cyanobacterium]|nr:vanadium-dependent haloperoxidase [Synechococcaceae cyanobacterium]